MEINGGAKLSRKSISKKLRFEVFKRDKFTCQYCGRKAPDVVLHVDHIVAVARNGTNDIMNLVTSCEECNLGKSYKALDDCSTLEKQRKQMEDLQARREQLKMLFEWRKGLEGIEEQSVDMLIARIHEIISPYTLSETGKQTISKLVSKFNMEEILDAINISKKQYLRYDNDGVLIDDTVEKFINKIGGIIVNNKKGPITAKLYYIRGICRNRFNYWNDRRGMDILEEFVDLLKSGGTKEEKIIEILDSLVVDLSKRARHWTEWHTTIDEWMGQISALNERRTDSMNKQKDE